jgi:hypothetical protein
MSESVKEEGSFMIGFEQEEDARRVMVVLGKRLVCFGRTRSRLDTLAQGTP